MSLALLFDIDGTLMDTLAAIVDAMNAAAKEFEVAPFRSAELRPMIGTPVQRQLQELRGISNAPADAFTERYYAHFTRLVDRGLRLYAEVRETFPALSNRRIATVSTRRRDEARHMLRVTGLEPYFGAIVGGDEVRRPKPSPDLPVFAAEALGVDPSKCVVIGDSPVDVRAGHAAGMRTVAVSYGYGDPAALRAAKPDAVIAHFADLPAILGSFEARAPP